LDSVLGGWTLVGLGTTVLITSGSILSG